MREQTCYCGSERLFSLCCEKVISTQANSAEELMRSRYTAFCLNDVAYIFSTEAETLHETASKEDVEKQILKQKFISLEVLSVSEHSVEFKARYLEGNSCITLHETSAFSCVKGKWLYNEAIKINIEEALITQRQECPCGSGKRFKHCCAKG